LREQSANGRHLVTETWALVVGDIIDDVHVVTEGAIRQNTDTLADIQVRPGGSAANTACWLGHLGSSVNFLGRVGVDDEVRHRVEFERFGVEANLQVEPGGHTGTIIVIVHGSSRTMLSDRGANLTLDVSDISFEDTNAPRVLHLTGYSFFHREPLDDLLALMDKVVQLGGDVVLDASSSGFLADHGAAWWWDIARHATVVRANEDEARFLTGCEDPREAVEQFTQNGVTGIVTLAEKGALCARPGESATHFPAHPLGPEGLVDPTGAGDSFSAGLISRLLAGGSLEQSVTEGLRVSALAVTQWGARPWSRQKR
jgi:sugar/nucleoside kinase (ribokinase family)